MRLNRCGIVAFVFCLGLFFLGVQPPAVAQVSPPSSPTAKAQGVFGAVTSWPLIPLHAALLPDGRLMTYGTTSTGVQSGLVSYDIWDPTLGTGPDSHLEMPNKTGTDLFCSAQSLLVNSGGVLLTGGDKKVGGVRNFSNSDVNIFNPQQAYKGNTNLGGALQRANQSMTFARWYPTIVPLPTGEKLLLGGRQDKGPIAAITPEVYTENVGWRTLDLATSDLAFGAKGGNWYYSRGYQLPNDPSKVIIIGNEGSLFYLEPAANGGRGSITLLPQKIRGGAFMFPTAKFGPGTLLSVRGNRNVVVVNINGATPTIAATASMNKLRIWSNATVLADGKVFVNGGSEKGNQLVGVAYQAETWDPATGQWTLSATAKRPRLYHSNAILLPDATVLTGGGGAPGPTPETNAEIYYPPYLYTNEGTPAPRPTINVYPTYLKMSDPTFIPEFWMTVGAGDIINRVTLLHLGSVTHSNNMEQSFQDLPVRQDGINLFVTTPRNPNYTVPGFYMMFAINTAGVPSVAKIVKVVR